MASVATRSCLSAAELHELRAAVPGQAPPELASHVAGCERCQQRLLFGDSPRPAARARRTPEWPSRQKALVLLAAVLVAVAMLLYSLQRLAAAFR